MAICGLLSPLGARSGASPRVREFARDERFGMGPAMCSGTTRPMLLLARLRRRHPPRDPLLSPHAFVFPALLVAIGRACAFPLLQTERAGFLALRFPYSLL